MARCPAARLVRRWRTDRVYGWFLICDPAGGANPELAWLFYEYMMLTVEGISAAFGPNEIYPGGITTVIPAYKPAFDEHLMENPESLGGQDLYTFATELVDEIPSNYYFPTWVLSIGRLPWGERSTLASR